SRATASIGLGGCGIDVVRIKAKLVVNFALLGIAQNVVGFRERLEFFFGCFVSGIDVRVILARKLAKRLADVVHRGGLLYAEDFVIVFFGCGGHLECRRFIARISYLYGTSRLTELPTLSRDFPSCLRYRE